MTITIPTPSLVLLIGPSGAGKSTFARRHFRTTEVLSSDFCRALVCDDESEQAATNDAFELLHSIVAKRLKRRRVTVIDATNVQASARRPLIDAANHLTVPLIGIVFLLPEDVFQARDQKRTYRMVGSDVIRSQLENLQQSLDMLKHEGFTSLFTLANEADADSAVVLRA